MSTTKPSIRSIYVGKPDAKGEVLSAGNDAFIKSFILPDNFTANSFLASDNCYITGYKGTGKTAILLYLQSQAITETAPALSSMIYFKTDIEPLHRMQMGNLGKKLFSVWNIDDAPIRSVIDYEYIWRWIIFKQIIDDNTSMVGTPLFINDDAWKEFVNYVEAIKSDSENRKFSIKNLSIEVGSSGLKPTSRFALDLTKDIADADSHATEFITLMKNAQQAFERLTRTEVPYFIFIDELEAYYSNEQAIFLRDLCLIRDLLFTAKYIHLSKKVRIICSVRTEIIEAISRYIPSKELNKAIEGFEWPLRWVYNNTNSYNHPIMRILLRRIQIAEENAGMATRDLKAIYDSWFAQKLDSREPANYILDFGWAKPRDIVRLILCAQKDNLHNNETSFTKAVFDSIKRLYSKSSLEEIGQELNALYSAQEISEIKRMFLGKPAFRQYSDICQSANSTQFKNTVWQSKSVDDILDDLFRIGFIGNYRKLNKRSDWRWRHKGDQELLKDKAHYICVHNALSGELAITSSGGRYGFIYDNTASQEEEIQPSKDTNISPVHIEHFGEKAKKMEELSSSADVILKCIECGNEFVFSMGEQEFYAQKGLSQPKRCVKCRKLRKNSQYDKK